MWVQVPPAPPMCASGRALFAELGQVRRSNAVTRRFESCLALQTIYAVLAQCRERIGPNDEDAG
jgi:hypothetical protein